MAATAGARAEAVHLPLAGALWYAKASKLCDHRSRRAWPGMCWNMGVERAIDAHSDARGVCPRSGSSAWRDASALFRKPYPPSERRATSRWTFFFLFFLVAPSSGHPLHFADPQYSQAVKAGGFLYTSGSVGMSKDGKMVEGTVQDRTRQVLANLKAVVEASGYTLNDAVKATCYLSNLDRDFEAFNEVSVASERCFG